MSERARRAWGSKDLGSLFPDDAPITYGVFKRAPIKRHDTEALEAAVRAGGPKRLYDPRELHASQGAVTRAGVKHYMDHPGTLYADRHQAGNKTPVVYSRGGVDELMSGHHRATAAILNGHQFEAIEVRE